MMKRLSLILLLCFFSGGMLYSQKATVTFIIKDSNSNKLVSSCVVNIRPGNRIFVSDTNGICESVVDQGSIIVKTSVMGYESKKKSYEVLTDTVIVLLLKPSIYSIKQVTVLADSIRYIRKTSFGSYIINTLSINDLPNQFSEPDLIKALQYIPGVIGGREGSSEMFVRGGTAGQNITYANEASFFLPNHLMGSVSPYDSDFMDNAELMKDYIPSSFGGGASSIVKIDYRKSKMDSMSLQFRLGFLSSGGLIDIPVKKEKTGVVIGIKKSNYSIYYPVVELLLRKYSEDFLPPSNYSYLNGFLRLDNLSDKWGDITYLLLLNNDIGKQRSTFDYTSADTLFSVTEGTDNGWNSMVQSITWKTSDSSKFKRILNLNYSSLSLDRNIFEETEVTLESDNYYESEIVSSRFSPSNQNIGLKILFSNSNNSIFFGAETRVRLFKSNILSTLESPEVSRLNKIDMDYVLTEPVLFFSSRYDKHDRLSVDAGIRLSWIFVENKSYFVPEPRIRISHKLSGLFITHLTYTRLNQSDHYIEGSGVGLRSSIWIPASAIFGPEVSDMISFSVTGEPGDQLEFELTWYYKIISDMLDFKPGAGFLRTESIYDKLDQIDGRAYGFEAGLIKRKGKLQGIASYTYSRSLREWYAPEGRIWISSSADRPHNISISSRYEISKKHSFGLNWRYSSGLPATLYIHSTSNGQWFESKNNIRYRPYHSLDFSFKTKLNYKRFTAIIDFNITNAYNRRNTYYLRSYYDQEKHRIIYKNISLFPLMPTLSITLLL